MMGPSRRDDNSRRGGPFSFLNPATSVRTRRRPSASIIVYRGRGPGGMATGDPISRLARQFGPHVMVFVV
jgi:hypothetical protein